MTGQTSECRRHSGLCWRMKQTLTQRSAAAAASHWCACGRCWTAGVQSRRGHLSSLSLAPTGGRQLHTALWGLVVCTALWSVAQSRLMSSCHPRIVCHGPSTARRLQTLYLACRLPAHPGSEQLVISFPFVACGLKDYLQLLGTLPQSHTCRWASQVAGSQVADIRAATLCLMHGTATPQL